MSGNFVVKQRDAKFNQVPIDQATEWQNRVCKISNGIIGITRNDTARDKFCVTWAERSFISHSTRVMLALEDSNDEKISTRKDAQPSRKKFDKETVENLKNQFLRFDVFKVPVGENGIPVVELQDINNVDQPEDELRLRLTSIATNDVATNEIQQDLLSAEDHGRQLVSQHVSSWFVDKDVPFFNTLKKNNSKTFKTMYQVKVPGKQNEQKVIKADRKLLQRLLTASMAGRKIKIDEILQHELASLPLSLCKINGDMNSTSKSDMVDILIGDTEYIHHLNLIPRQNASKTCIVIDGHALVQALGKPHNCKTFRDYADVFFKAVKKYIDESVKRVDLLFDTYIDNSIKTAARAKRNMKKRPIRRIIDREDLPVPQVWENFIALPENKADLANFLSEHLMQHGHEIPHCELVTSGGFKETTKACSTFLGEITHLTCNHEEADTRIILHACDAVREGFNRLLVVCRDTDVLLLLIHFLGTVGGVETWMVAGSAKQRKCYPVHTIAERLPSDIIDNILGFHALTGCDTTSSFTGFGKRKCWKVFEEYPNLLHTLGRNGLKNDIEEFVCRLYRATNPLSGVNKCRSDLFEKGNKDLEKLPPTEDALSLHIARANYQTKIWLQANLNWQTVGLPTETGGWQLNENILKVVWTTLASIPSSCLNLISCGCTKKCNTAACKCYKSSQQCTPICGCDAQGCKNPFSSS